MSGDYFSLGVGSNSREVWRVNEDGVCRDPFNKLTKVFEMSEKSFFDYFSTEGDMENHRTDEYDKECRDFEDRLTARCDERDFPFTKVWIASKIIRLIPQDAFIHFSILGSLRAGDFFRLPVGVRGNCNVGGFGIDGPVSTLLGASLANKDKLHFLMVGDLAFFYDMNALGNRHVGNNVRILLVNNGDGTEFRMHWHPVSAFSKEEADRYISAGGHFGNQSHSLVKHYAEDLGFEYMQATSKEEFMKVSSHFLSAQPAEKPMFLEVFTNSEDDAWAVNVARTLVKDRKIELKQKTRKFLSSVLGAKAMKMIKGLIR